MSSNHSFSDELCRITKEYHFTLGQLSGMTKSLENQVKKSVPNAQLFVPKATLQNWLEGRVRKPRDMHKIVGLVAIMRLPKAVASSLLRSAGYPTIGTLKQMQIEDDNRDLILLLLALWDEETQQQPDLPLPLYNPPFPATESSEQSLGVPSANPFWQRGRINDPSLFFDRRHILQELQQMVIQGCHVSLVGEMEIGKSSVLYHLYQTQAGWFPQAKIIYIDMQRVTDDNDFWANAMGHPSDPQEFLKELRARELQGGRVVLLLDEIDKMASSSFSPDLQDQLRSLAQEVSLTLVTASHNQLKDVLPRRSNPYTSPLHNIFTERRLREFTLDDARDFLETRLSGTGIAFTAREMKRLVRKSNGHPASLQRMAYALFEEKRKEK